MGLNANDAGGGNSNYIPVEAGTYPGRLVSVVDLGLQTKRPWQGQEKAPAQEIALTYELVDEFMLDEDGQPLEDKPRWLTEIMPLHNLKADKAKSTLRYKALDPTEANDGDFSKLLNTPINITIVINPAKGGKVYENVASISPMRPKDAEKCPPLVNAARFFDLDAPDLDVFMTLPRFIKERIQKNLEYAGSPLEALLKDAKDDGPGKSEGAAPAKDAAEADEHPF